MVVAARRGDRLQGLADELTAEHGAEVLAVKVDLSRADGVNTLAAATDGLDVGLVVSNAGGSPPGGFLRTDLETHHVYLNLNAATPMGIAHEFGRRFVARGGGGIILVSSTAAFNGTPYLSNYAAAKAYQLVLGEGLRVEFAKRGVDVLVLAPGPTLTEMAQTEGVDFSNMPVKWMKPEDVAAAGLAALGRKSFVVPGGANKLMRIMTSRLMTRTSATVLWGSMMTKATDERLL